jgi:hypothetical protein
VPGGRPGTGRRTRPALPGGGRSRGTRSAAPSCCSGRCPASWCSWLQEPARGRLWTAGGLDACGRTGERSGWPQSVRFPPLQRALCIRPAFSVRLIGSLSPGYRVGSMLIGELPVGHRLAAGHYQTPAGRRPHWSTLTPSSAARPARRGRESGAGIPRPLTKSCYGPAGRLKRPAGRGGRPGARPAGFRVSKAVPITELPAWARDRVARALSSHVSRVKPLRIIDSKKLI